MDAKGILQFQLNGSFNLLTEIAEEATDLEWRSRSFPAANLVGFTVWHGARTLDWAVNCVMRDSPEVADQSEWRDIKVAGAVFGAGVSRETADEVVERVTRTRVGAYIKAVRQETLAWLGDLRDEDLSATTDLKQRHAAKPEYMAPAVWEEVESLHGIPGWQFLARPCMSHIRVHYGELKTQLEALRTAPPA